MPLLFAPTIGAALAAPILVTVDTFPAYRTTRAVDLRILDRALQTRCNKIGPRSLSTSADYPKSCDAP
jgi:hypothetical protein